jgi:hypothetical protein
MPLLGEIFYVIGQAKAFNILDLWFNCHQLSLCESDKVKIVYWNINQNGKDYLYQWNFQPFGLKNVLTKFQKAMN